MRLFPFQEIGRDHLAGQRVALLADEMGLGKSVQALRASEVSPAERLTIICPAIMCAEWRDTLLAAQEVPRRVAVLGAKDDRGEPEALIVSYDRAAKPEIAERLKNRSSAHLIVDEAHYVKEPEAKRTLAVLGECGIADHAARVSFLTGTPAPNHAGELFPMLRAAGRVPDDYWTFLRRYCVIRETPYGPKVTKYRDAAGLRALLDGFILRRTNAVELPPTERGEIIVEPRECAGENVLAELRRLDPLAASLVKRAATIESFADLETPHVATLRRYTGIAKVTATAERAAALLAGDPAAKLVLFCIHRQVLQQFMQRLQNFSPVLLAGGDSDKIRRANKERFQTDATCRVAVCQMQAAGTGLTLTAANHLWIIEPSWTPADNEQALKRIVRIGQTRKTFVNFITLDTSIDLAVNRVLRAKRQLIDEIIC